ncbi:MAG: polyphenol oxidase family protein, partial [Acidimicrobiales bacterium]
SVRLGSTPVQVLWTAKDQGDLGPRADALQQGPLPAVLKRWREVVDLPWSWLRQVHGSDVVSVGGSEVVSGVVGDALVSGDKGACLAVFTADCAPVALASPEGVMGAVHAGWRGLLAGVIGETAASMRSLGATRLEAALGPCIHGECNEFAEPDLQVLEHRFGPSARSTTSWGRPAFDVPSAVAAALEEEGATLVGVARECTACSGRYFSHRARGDRSRQAMAVWHGDPAK